jgi:pyoverdine/dityrosine biosynthesis protein Dit1/alpha-ketoglutarate-dependent taurine dioxygenase
MESTHHEAASTTSPSVIDTFIQEFKTIQSRYEEPGMDVFESRGKHDMQKTLQAFIDAETPITMVLPAFPFKSPNNDDKVLGKLPDRGEELALERLESFCKSIERVYPLGCHVVIFSDGRVFNDLLGVSNDELKAYKNELKAIVKDAGHTHIRFDGLENYTHTEDPIKEILERFNVEKMDMGEKIKQDAGLLNTYRSFRIFLRRDLASQFAGLSNSAIDKRCGEIAKKMMHRNIGFSTLVDVTYPHALRVSIHLYDNAGPKFGIHLVTHTAGIPRTPWHSVMCEDADGTVHKLELRDVDHSKYELVEKRGRAWGFREYVKAVDVQTLTVSENNPVDTDVEDDEDHTAWAKLNVEFIEEPLLLTIRASPSAATPPSLMDIPVKSFRKLIHKHGVVNLQGFKQDDDLEKASERIGEVMQWPWGTIFEIKSVQDTALTGQTLESMPMHYDGMYKKKTEDSTELGDVPLFMLFHCVEAYPSPDPSEPNGSTLMARTRPILDTLTAEEKERLSNITLVYNTSLFGHQELMHTSPVIIKHPVTGEDVLRYHEPWGPEKTKLHPTTVKALQPDGSLDSTDAEWVSDLLVEKLYDPKYCHAHSWTKGEFVIVDNFAMIHARTGMKSDGRHVRRVHIN